MTPEATLALTPTTAPEPFEGIWATPPLDWEDWEAAIVAKGLDPAGAEDLIVAREDYVDYVQFEFELRDADWLLYQINDGLNFGVALSGDYEMSDADTFVMDADEAECDVTFDLAGDAEELRVEVAEASGADCSENYDIRVQVAVYESAPFHLVEPAGGFVADPGLSPTPQPKPSPAPTLVVTESRDRYTLHPVGTVEGVALGYTEYLPPDYDAAGSSPLIVFLHGSGESGPGTEVSLHYLSQSGLALPITNNRWPDDRPFVVLSPQHRTCEPGAVLHADGDRGIPRLRDGPLRRGSVSRLPDGSELRRDRPLELPRLPQQRSRRCGRANRGLRLRRSRPQRLRAGELPLWAFHGTDDENVYLRGDTYPLTYLADCTDPAPVDARLTVFQDAGHDVWTRVYNGTAGYDIFSWMLSHTK